MNGKLEDMDIVVQ